MDEQYDIPRSFDLFVRRRRRFQWEARLTNGITVYRERIGFTRAGAIRSVLRRYRNANLPWEAVR